MRRLARDRVLVECCLSSNYHTGAVKRGDAPSHPRLPRGGRAGRDLLRQHHRLAHGPGARERCGPRSRSGSRPWSAIHRDRRRATRSSGRRRPSPPGQRSRSLTARGLACAAVLAAACYLRRALAGDWRRAPYGCARSRSPCWPCSSGSLARGEGRYARAIAAGLLPLRGGRRPARASRDVRGRAWSPSCAPTSPTRPPSSTASDGRRPLRAVPFAVWLPRPSCGCAPASATWRGR